MKKIMIIDSVGDHRRSQSSMRSRSSMQCRSWMLELMLLMSELKLELKSKFDANVEGQNLSLMLMLEPKSDVELGS